MNRRRPHPVSWWTWALCLATVAALSHNPWLHLLIIVVTALVVVSCKGDEPWAGAWRVFFFIGLFAIVIRFSFYLIFGGSGGSTVLFTLPQWNLGDTSLHIGGPVTLEGAMAALYDGLRLATILICVGAANALASPRRLLAALPAALYEVALALIVALSLAPQLVAATGRIRRARALRGDTGRGPIHFMHTVVTPVLTDALDNSLHLAASMASRGYGRATHANAHNSRIVTVLMLAALGGITMATFGLLSSTTPAALTWSLLAIGVVLAVVAIYFGSKRLHHTRYRPDRFHMRDWAIVSVGLLAVAAVFFTPYSQLWPTTLPLIMPPIPVTAMAGVLITASPAFFAHTVATVSDNSRRHSKQQEQQGAPA